MRFTNTALARLCHSLVLSTSTIVIDSICAAMTNSLTLTTNIAQNSSKQQHHCSSPSPIFFVPLSSPPLPKPINNSLPSPFPSSHSKQHAHLSPNPPNPRDPIQQQALPQQVFCTQHAGRRYKYMVASGLCRHQGSQQQEKASVAETNKQPSAPRLP